MKEEEDGVVNDKKEGQPKRLSGLPYREFKILRAKIVDFLVVNNDNRRNK